jgi:hypothetical protein
MRIYYEWSVTSFRVSKRTCRNVPWNDHWFRVNGIVSEWYSFPVAEIWVPQVRQKQIPYLKICRLDCICRYHIYNLLYLTEYVINPCMYVGRVAYQFPKSSSFVLLYWKFILLIIQPFLGFSFYTMRATWILITVFSTFADIANSKFN